MRSKRILFLGLTIVILAACQPAAPPEEPTPRPTMVAATAPPASEPATSEPTEPTLEPQADTPSVLLAAWDYGRQGYAYQSEGSLCLMQGETPVRLNDAADAAEVAAPSPDGQKIAYVRSLFNTDSSGLSDPSSELWVGNTDGSDQRVVLTSEELLAQFPTAHPHFTSITWLPNSTQFVFTTRDSPEFSPFHQPQLALYRYDTTADELIAALPPPPPDEDGGDPANYYVLSPDGEWAALYDYNHLSFVRTDGSAYNPNVFQFEWYNMGCGAFPRLDPVWEADSNGVTIVMQGWVPENPQPDLEVGIRMMTWFVPVDGEPVLIGEFEEPLLATGCGNEVFVLAPDRQRIAYALLSGPIQMGIIGLDGSDHSVIVDEPPQGEESLAGTVTWDDDNTVLFTLLNYEPGRLAYLRHHLDGTETPLETEALPRMPLLSCSP